jgi:hypothetical protein
MRHLLLIGWTIAALQGQPADAPAANPAALENLGKPMTVKAACTVEMVNDLGLSCSVDEPCAIYLELSDVSAVADRLVVSGNLHTSTTTLESILLSSDNGGKTWVEPHARIPMAVLDRVQFFDFELGWINGHILQPTPKDAFFLITSDGGKTWRKRPIMGESSPGAVQHFWFDSRTHGLMLIERPPSDDGMRHELWESMTGGDSWNVRQVDAKPIPVARPSASPPSWRIRSDSKTQAHRIERQAGARWESVASFSVSAGECKPAPPPATEVPAIEVPLEDSEPVKPAPPKRTPTLRPKRNP